MKLPGFFITLGTILHILFKDQLENFEYLRETLFITFIISFLYLLERRIRLTKTHLLIRNINDVAIQITCFLLSLLISVFLFQPWIAGHQYYYFGIFLSGIFLISGLVYENSMQISYMNNVLVVKNLYKNTKQNFSSFSKIEIDRSVIRIIDNEKIVEISGFRDNIKDKKKIFQYLTQKVNLAEVEIINNGCQQTA
ncbi:hypothetical protein [Carboxylicivirga linearis]|uniref:DUF5673 domain-containing protein n=1 Tax=Carboxylicivirga linearis TaxID=1628157 RepID=A0ABS5K242_9BACT|nr:hypothetical protein [Carboxylicivirga linearis]MBS2101211.1 hypothetical protein [Carboxylicivirga linearis]